MTDIEPPPTPTEPWAVRDLGLTHYYTNFRRCVAGILIGSIFGAVAIILYESISFAEFSIRIPRTDVFWAAWAFFILAVGIPVVAGLPWWGLHASGFRGPICAMCLGPILFLILLFLIFGQDSLSPRDLALLGWLASIGLVIWRVAYRRQEPAIDPAIFA